MDITILKEDLIDGIQVVQNAVSQKSNLPILSNVLLETGDKSLKLTATDLDLGICAVVPAVVANPGAITIPARKFFDIVKALPDQSEIEISVKKTNFASIKSGKAQFKIVGLPKEEFPQLPAFKDKDSIVMEQKNLKEMINLTDFAISRDDTRYILNGILIKVKQDKVSAVATDGRRLAEVNRTLPKRTLVERDVVVPVKTVQEVKRMLKDEGDVQISFSDNQVLFSFPACFILSRLIEGEYPNYKKVIPEKSNKEIKISREGFLSATKRADIFTDQDSMAIKLNIKKKKMTILKDTPYLGEAREDVEIDYSGDDELEIGFNPKYLIDVLRNLPDSEITFEVNDPAKPGVIRRGEKGEEYTYVVLPMQVSM